MILQPTKENIEYVIKELTNGNIVIFPTDTVFGIGCIATNSKSIEKIYELKKRDKTKSLLLNVANITNIKRYARVNKTSQHLIKNFMPGGLSLILPVKENSDLSPYVIKDKRIGIRIPANKTIIKILKKIKTPLVSTSCNKSGNSACITATDAEKIFGKKIIILNTNEKLSGLSSSIVEATNTEINYIREGQIKFDTIKRKLKDR